MPTESFPSDCPSENGQIDKFWEAARELTCEDDEQAFNRKVRNLLNAMPLESKRTGVM
jgi:hypothetical protein